MPQGEPLSERDQDSASSRDAAGASSIPSSSSGIRRLERTLKTTGGWWIQRGRGELGVVRNRGCVHAERQLRDDAVLAVMTGDDGIPTGCRSSHLDSQRVLLTILPPSSFFTGNTGVARFARENDC